MRLILIRHGETPANVDGVLESTAPGPGLTALGDDQAAKLPTALAGEKIGAIFASTQIRSQVTAALLADSLGLPVEVRDGLREIAAGNLEGLTDRPSVIRYVTTFLCWIDGELDVRMPGAEGGHELLKRFHEVVAEAEESGHDTVAFVSHGAVIRTWAGTTPRISAPCSSAPISWRTPATSSSRARWPALAPGVLSGLRRLRHGPAAPRGQQSGSRHRGRPRLTPATKLVDSAIAS